jgi:hypothetical protein
VEEAGAAARVPVPTARPGERGDAAATARRPLRAAGAIGCGEAHRIRCVRRGGPARRAGAQYGRARRAQRLGAAQGQAGARGGAPASPGAAQAARSAGAAALQRAPSFVGWLWPPLLRRGRAARRRGAAQPRRRVHRSAERRLAAPPAVTRRGRAGRRRRRKALHCALVCPCRSPSCAARIRQRIRHRRRQLRGGSGAPRAAQPGAAGRPGRQLGERAGRRRAARRPQGVRSRAHGALALAAAQPRGRPDPTLALAGRRRRAWRRACRTVGTTSSASTLKPYLPAAQLCGWPAGRGEPGGERVAPRALHFPRRRQQPGGAVRRGRERCARAALRGHDQPGAAAVHGADGRVPRGRAPGPPGPGGSCTGIDRARRVPAVHSGAWLQRKSQSVQSRRSLPQSSGRASSVPGAPGKACRARRQARSASSGARAAARSSRASSACSRDTTRWKRSWRSVRARRPALANFTPTWLCGNFPPYIYIQGCAA